jgi:hypothetical protein
MDDIDKTFQALKRVPFEQLEGVRLKDKASLVLELRRQGWSLTEYLAYESRPVSSSMRTSPQQILAMLRFRNIETTPTEREYQYWDALSIEELESKRE